MKRIYSILTLLSLTLCIYAQQTDPALTAAVTAQTVTLKSLFDARHSTQEKILAATGIENVHCSSSMTSRGRCWTIWLMSLD